MHLPQIRFEDNDYAEKVSREDPNHILTVWEYIHIYETDPPPVKENDEIVKTLSPRQMYASRCKWCALCKKRDCGSCTSCRNNKGVPHNDIIKRQACLQKVRHDANALNVRNRQLTTSESPARISDVPSLIRIPEEATSRRNITSWLDIHVH